MPASYLPSRKVLQSSANLVLRRQPNLFCSHGFFLALPQSATVSKYYQLENIYFQTGSPRRFSHTCSVPLVTSDYQFYLRTGNSLFQESTKGSQTFKFLRSMVSALSSLSWKSEFGVRDPDISTVMEYWAKPSDFHKGDILRPNRKYELPSGSFRLPSKCHENAHMLTLKPQLFACGAEVMSGLCQRSRRKDLLVMSTLAGHNRNLQYGKRVSGCLRNREPWGNNMFYKCFWSDVSGSIWNISHHSEPCMKNFSSSSTPCSTGAVPNASIDGVSQEKQLENSGASSDQKLSGDRALKLLSGSCYLPHPEKEETGGEDAHFISTDQAIGVADGVGGWADLGVDAGQYARELMSHSVSAISEEPKGSIDPARVLEKAYISTKARGSSTACIVALTNQGVHAVNLGDSGFIIVRDGCAVFRSPVQQHDFNFTYQLESGNASDLPSSGQVFSLPVMAGDVIVAGTDGLFDNLYSNEVTAVVVHAIKEGLGPQLTAQRIAALARQCALDRNRHSPFSAAAQEAGYRYYGGKLDDITVVVSYVTVTST